MTTPLDTVIDRLRAAGCNPRQSRPGQWNSRCPNTAAHTHGDRNPSLSVGEGPDGRALICCQTGCDPETVVRALNLGMGDLFPPKDPAANGNGHRRAETYDYTDIAGRLLFQVVRSYPKGFRQRRPDGLGGWVWNLDGIDARPLYNLPQVAAAVAAGMAVWVVEGEKDADALNAHLAGGAVATTNVGGAGKWRPEHAATLDGAAEVNVVGDDDPKGRDHAQTVVDALAGRAGRVRYWLPHHGHKDIAEHLGAGRGLDQLRLIFDSAGGEDDATTWEPFDLAAIVTGTFQQPKPTILGRKTR